MDKTEIKILLRSALTRDLLLDLQDSAAAVAFKAHKMIKDHSGLDAKRARPLEGLARFRMFEKAFEEVCQQHGGFPLEEDLIPGTDLKVYQPFMRFPVKESGVILGFASMPDEGTLPPKNKSRLAGVSLNFNLSLRLDFGEGTPKPGDVFALFLTSKDKNHAGKLIEIGVGIIDAEYQEFLFYETIEEFLAEDSNWEPEAEEGYSNGEQTDASNRKVKLKDKIKPFSPPESPDVDDEDLTA